MKNELELFFEKENIEFYGVLDFSSVSIVNERLLAREIPGAKSIIMFLLPYYAGETENLSIYAASLDYHIIIKEVTDRLIKLLSSLYQENRAVGFGDHSPINEIHAAARCGLGVIGKNGLLINKKYGSYVFVAEVITDIPMEELSSAVPSDVGYCRGCGACLRACPTGILRGEGDSCLSFITQKKGELSEYEVSLMKKHSTVWGCDICQKVCPHNFNPKKTPLDFFSKERIPRLDYETAVSMNDEEFKRRAFAWRGRKTVLRNLELFENNGGHNETQGNT